MKKETVAVANSDLARSQPEAAPLSDEETLRRFDEVRARIQERTATISEEEIAADVAAARGGSSSRPMADFFGAEAAEGDGR